MTINSMQIYYDRDWQSWVANTDSERWETLDCPRRLIDCLTDYQPLAITVRLGPEGIELPWSEAEGIEMISLQGYFDLHSAEHICQIVKAWSDTRPA